MKYLIFVIFGIAIIMYLVAVMPKCLQSHIETRHQGAYTSFIPVGKIMVPQYHPEYDYTIEVCDVYEK